MSFVSKIQTRISNKEYLIKALKNLGYNPLIGNQTLTVYGNSVSVDILIKVNNRNIGFIKRPNNIYEMALDNDYRSANAGLVSRLEKEVVNIENKIKQEYAYKTTIEKMKEKGFVLEEETRENGEIRIKLTRIV